MVRCRGIDGRCDRESAGLWRRGRIVGVLGGRSAVPRTAMRGCPHRPSVVVVLELLKDVVDVELSDAGGRVPG